MDRFTAEVGRALRRARQARGLTLRGVGRLSHGRFKPTSVAGYERGERKISLERLRDLADFYRIPSDRLLGRVLDRLDPEGRREIVVDLRRLAEEEAEEARLISDYVRDVQAARGDYRAELITLRSGDVEILARASGREPTELLGRLKGVVRRGGEGGPERPRRGGPPTSVPAGR